MGNMGERLGDASRYEILYDRDAGSYERAEVGGIRTRTIRAGESIEVECYPLTRIGAAAKAEDRRRRQSPAQAIQNRKNAAKRIRRLVETNFTVEDYVLTLTWDYGQVDAKHVSYAERMRRWELLKLPVEEEDARRALANYWRRVRGQIRRAGESAAALKYLYVLEITHMNREGPRPDPHHYHFHAVIHAPGLSRDELEALWPHGRAQCNRLSLRDDGAAHLSAYMTKHHSTEEIDSSGRRIKRWNHSKNLKEPRETVSDRKVSRRRAALVAEDVQRNGREIFEAIYPGYQAVEVTVRFSDFVAGAYIFARLRRINSDPPWVRKGRKQE